MKVRLGDVSVEAYERLMGLFEQAMVMMAPFEHARDGLGLEERAITKKQAAKVTEQAVTAAGTDNRMSGHSNILSGLGASLKMRTAGRPTNTRDKAPYEGMNKSRFCSICKTQDH